MIGWRVGWVVGPERIMTDINLVGLTNVVCQVGLAQEAVAAALEVARDAEEGAVILAMLPDTGERYFSTPLFQDVSEGSDDEWLAGL